jgi:amidase
LQFYVHTACRLPLDCYPAAFIAHRELGRWMVAEYDFTEFDAHMLLTQAGCVRLENMVEPKYTLGASISKSLLA